MVREVNTKEEIIEGILKRFNLNREEIASKHLRGIIKEVAISNEDIEEAKRALFHFKDID